LVEDEDEETSENIHEHKGFRNEFALHTDDFDSSNINSEDDEKIWNFI